MKIEIIRGELTGETFPSLLTAPEGFCWAVVSGTPEGSVGTGWEFLMPLGIKGIRNLN